MRRRWIGLSTITAASAAVAFAGWFPYYRLEREVASARAEGLWTELSDIPKGIAAKIPSGENAEAIVNLNVAEMRKHGLRRPDIREAVEHLLKGKPSAADRDLVRQTAAANSNLLASWRKAAECPRLDYGRDWRKGYAVLFPELSELNFASRLLVAAAALQIQPKENLLAAARLSVLVRQEPNLITNIVSVSMGRTALREAKRQGLGAEVEKALGPPIDVRWSYMGELPCALDTMRRVGSPEWFKELGTQDGRGFFERIRNTGPWKANAAYRLVHDYREMWRAMPMRSNDYATAIQAIDRWVPKINGELTGSSYIMAQLMDTSSRVSDTVKSFQNFEAERKAVKANESKP